MINIDISENISQLSERLSSLDKSAMLHDVALVVMGRIRKRVHVEGKASDGSLIGQYSKQYLVVRSGLFKNSKVAKSGKNTGNVTSAGHHIKGKNAVYDLKTRKSVAAKESRRIMYKRGTDPKIILSLTRNMENDMCVIQTDNGFGIGYSNPQNLNKATWNEQRYKKPIWKLSAEENELAVSVVNSYLNDIING